MRLCTATASLVPCLVPLDPRLLAASSRHPIAPFQRPRVDGPTFIGPDPRLAQPSGAVRRRARVMAALGRALREDGREEGMRFHVRCARAGGESVGVRKVDGSTVGKFAGT